MPLQKPYNIRISNPLDTKEINEITWLVTGDIQFKFKIDIYENTTNALKFSSGEVQSYSLSYNLPANSVTNGSDYKLFVTVYNQAGNSQISDNVIFKASSRPVITTPSIGVISSPSYQFSATYSQGENVNLRSWLAYLYNEDFAILQNSGLNTSASLEHTFSGLESGESYYIEFQATSADGLIGTSGRIPFTASFPTPIVNLELTGKNIENAGVELSWFVGQIVGETDGSQYINGEKIDTTDGTKVWFDSGFTVNGNFSMKILMEDLIGNKPLVTMNGENGRYVLKYDSIIQKFILNKYILGTPAEYFSEVVNGNNYAISIEQVGNNEVKLEAITY